MFNGCILSAKSTNKRQRRLVVALRDSESQ